MEQPRKDDNCFLEMFWMWHEIVPCYGTLYKREIFFHFLDTSVILTLHFMERIGQSDHHTIGKITTHYVLSHHSYLIYWYGMTWKTSHKRLLLFHFKRQHTHTLHPPPHRYVKREREIEIENERERKGRRDSCVIPVTKTRENCKEKDLIRSWNIHTKHHHCFWLTEFSFF